MGMPSGMIPTSSFSIPSALSTAVSRCWLRRACTMSSALRPISTPPAILKAPMVIAEQAEDQAAAQGEGRQGDGAGPGAPLGHLTTHIGRVPSRHGEERRHRGERIDDEQDRREDEEQILERPQRVAHIATCTTRSLPARFAAYIAWSALRSSPSVPASVPETATTPMLAVTEGVPRNTVRMPPARRVATA